MFQNLNSLQINLLSTSNLLIDPDSEKPDRALESSSKVQLNEQYRLITKIVNKRTKPESIGQISEHSKDNDDNQLSNMSEVLKSRREAKRVMKNDEAIMRAEVNTTKFRQGNEKLQIDKPVTAAPVDYSNQGGKKAMYDNNSGVGSSKRHNSNLKFKSSNLIQSRLCFAAATKVKSTTVAKIVKPPITFTDEEQSQTNQVVAQPI